MSMSVYTETLDIQVCTIPDPESIIRHSRPQTLDPQSYIFSNFKSIVRDFKFPGIYRSQSEQARAFRLPRLQTRRYLRFQIRNQSSDILNYKLQTPRYMQFQIRNWLPETLDAQVKTVTNLKLVARSSRRPDSRDPSIYISRSKQFEQYAIIKQFGHSNSTQL